MTNIYSKIPEENDQEILEYNDEDEDTLTETSTNSTDTLNEKLSTTITTEDASVYCNFCREFVYFGDLKMHRRLHKALDVMQINSDLNLLNIKYLAKRRSKLIRLLNQLPNNEKYAAIKRIDDEFSVLYNFLICETLQEFPKSNLINPDSNSLNLVACKTFDLLRDTKVRYRGFLDNIWQLACAHRLEQDGLSFFNGEIDGIGDIYGIATGHNGVLAQKFVAEQFLSIFKNQFDSLDEEENRELKLELSLKKTFAVLDQNLSSGRIDIQSYKTFSSCTVELVIYHSKEESQKNRTNNNIIITTVNLGSGRVILVTDNGFSVLNKSHSTISNKSERERVENEGGRLGYLNDSPYLNGQTDITRSLGGQGNMDLKLFQSIEPQIEQLYIEEEHRGIIVMNCFLANVMSDEDAANLFNNEYPNPTREEDLSVCKDDSSATDSTNTLESIWDSCSSTNQSATYKISQSPISTSETVVRKLINAAVLLTKVDRKYATIVFCKNNIVSSSDT